MIAPFDLSGEASAALSVLTLALLVRQPGSAASSGVPAQPPCICTLQPAPNMYASFHLTP